MLSSLKNEIDGCELGYYCVSSSSKNEINVLKHSYFSVSSLCKNETSHLEKCIFLVSSSLKNKTDLDQSSFFIPSSLKNETDPSIVSRLNIWAFISSSCKVGETKLGGHVPFLFILVLSYLTIILGENTNHWTSCWEITHWWNWFWAYFVLVSSSLNLGMTFWA